MTAPPRMDEARGVGRRDAWVLLLTLLVIATNGIISELLIAGYSAYLLGDSIYQFSLIIGLYLSAMGVGSFLTRRMVGDLLGKFVLLQLVIALIGGASAFLLSVSFAFTRNYELVMVIVTVLIGACVGAEIPLVTRIIAERGPLRKVIADVLSYDYLGALAGSLLFPLVLLPALGFLRTALALGLVSLAVAFANLIAFRGRLRRAGALASGGLVIGALLGGVFVFAGELQDRADEERHEGKIVFSQQSKYQRIVLTEREGIYRLWLNGHRQFSTRTEHRYHDVLVHPAMSLAPSRSNVLILGGGDGLALREIWKYRDVKRVVMVDLDPAMTDLARAHELFVKWNEGAMRDPRLVVVNDDAWKFLTDSRLVFDVVIVDLPEPTNISISKLYTVEFYSRLKERMTDAGIAAIQSGEIWPLRRKPMSCVARSLRAAGLEARPYNLVTYAWILASKRPLQPERARITVPTRFLTDELMAASFDLDRDFQEVETKANRIDSHALLTYYFDY